MASTQQVRQTRKTPPPPAPTNTDQGAETPFWDWLASFDSDQWSNMIVYLWRCAPTVERKAAGKPTSIGKMARSFDMETILKEHGSGHYRFDVCRIPSNGSPQARIRQHYEVIMNMDYPPRVPLGDWINDPENEMWKWAEEPLKLDQARTKARIEAIENGSPTTPADPTAIFSTVLEGVRSLRGEKDDNAGLAGQLLQMVMTNQETMRAMNDPTRQLTTLKALMTELSPQQRGPDMSTMMLEFMRDQVTALREELKEMRNGTNKRSVVEELKEFTTVFTELAPSLGFNKRGPAGTPNPAANGGTDWGNVIKEVGPMVLPFLTAAMQRLGNGAPPAPAQGWTPQLPAATAQPVEQQQPAHAQQQQPQQQGEQPDMSTLPPEQRDAVLQLQAKMQACWTKYQQLITAVVPFLIDRFKARETGYEMRDWFLDRHGRNLWVQFKDDGGPEVLTALAGTHPYLKTVLTPPEQVMQYFVEFFTEPEDDEDEDDDNGDTLPVGADHAA